MSKNKTLRSFTMAMLFIIMFPITVYANSSWYWVSTTRPLDLLPIVVIITLLLEILSINYIAKINNLKRVIPVVSIANLLSFLLPYAWLGISPRNVYVISSESIIDAIKYTVEHTPFFTVSFLFLLITLLVETPIVYLFFKSSVIDKKKLIFVIITINILTTAITFEVERLFCYGEW